MANKNHINFFTNQAANIKTPPIKVEVLDVALFVAGIFDGATVALQVSPDALNADPELMTWFDHPAGIFTDLTQNEVRFWNNADLAEVYIRGILDNVGAATNLAFKMRPRVEMAV